MTSRDHMPNYRKYPGAATTPLRTRQTIFKGANLNLSELRSKVRNLLKNSTVQVSNLGAVSPALKEDYEYVTRVVSRMKGSDMYTSIVNTINTAAAEFGTMKYDVGSVGAYLQGCFIHSNFPGNPACDPLCLGSVCPGTTAEGWVPCSQTVLSYNGANNFKSLNAAHSEDGVIVIPANVPFSGAFVDSEIETLQQMGLKSYIVYRYVAGEYTELLKGSFGAGNSTRSSSTGGFNWWWLLLVLLIIIIIVALGYYFYKRQVKKQVKKAATPNVVMVQSPNRRSSARVTSYGPRTPMAATSPRVQTAVAGTSPFSSAAVYRNADSAGFTN